ncbi:MAG: hypothetical protein GXP25_24795 [Planctomycetes bacterium]|nr:hypothetical protein [Planctomycetota bacterium]
MRGRWRHLAIAFLVSTGLTAHAQPYRTSFETGNKGPDGWRLVSGKGEWSKEGRNGGRCLSLFGTGEGSGRWQSKAMTFRPGAVYRLSGFLRADTDKPAGPVPLGMRFCTRDQRPNKTWAKKILVGRAPLTVFKNAYLYFGAYHVGGNVYCDDVVLEEVCVTHRNQNGITLGIGERIDNGTYIFRSSFGSELTNICRPAVEHTCKFHSDRLWFNTDKYALYRIEVAGYPLLSGDLSFTINWYQDGECVVGVSKDGKTWRDLGRFSPTGNYRVTFPADMYPAERVFFRFLGAGNFQINKFTHVAKLQGSPPNTEGHTEVYVGHYVSADGGPIRLQWGEERAELVRVYSGDRLVGSMYGVVAQFEKRGVGYKGAGIGSAGADVVKQVTVKTKDEKTCVVDVVAVRTESAAAARKFEATYRFTLHADQPWFEARLMSVKNTDTIPYKIVGYYHRLQPELGAKVRPACYGPIAAWLGDGEFLAALAKDEADFTLAFRKSETGCRGDITRPLDAPLTPGASWSNNEPGVVVFVGEGDEKALALEADRIRGMLARPEAKTGGGRIIYEEEGGDEK